MYNASTFFHSLEKFTHRSFLYVFILVALIMMLIKCDKKQRFFIILSVVISLLIAFNPISFSILYKITNSSSYRIFWLFPAWFAFAYTITVLAQLIKPLKIRFIIVTAISILLTAYCLHNNSYSFVTSSPYQIPYSTIQLADKMESILDERGLDSAVLYGNYDFLATLRQYNARFILQTAPRNHSLMENNAGKNNYLGLGHFITTGESPIEKDFAADILNNNKVYFIVIHRELTDSISYLNSIGWYEITGNDSYTVLCQDLWDEKRDE